MSLIRSKRNDLYANAGNPNVGPGTYEAVVPDFKPKSGMAPFGSTTERITMALSRNPGPGEYETAVPSIKVQSNPGPQFLSRVPRLQSTDRHADNLPGPGAYTQELVRPPPQHRPVGEALHSGSGINWVKVATAPSIPTNTQSYGYREGSYGELIQQPVPYQGHTGCGSDLPGPGSYDLTRSNPSRATNFAKGAGRTFSPPKKDDAPGPGYYNVEMVDKSVVFKGGVHATRPTSMFASTTTRANLLTTMHGPGPGSFKPPSSFKSMREYLAAHPDTFQAFGSSAADPRRDLLRLEVPGPGYYNADVKPIAAKEGGASSVFLSKADRFHSNAPIGPGPGGFFTDAKTIAREVSSKLRGRFGAFGSTSARLPPPPKPRAPSPVAYNPPIDVAPAERRRKDKRTPAFRESGKREDPSHSTQGANTFYDAKKEWPKPQSTSSAFISSVPRFTAQSASEVPGPGHYPPKNNLVEATLPSPYGPRSTWGKGRRFDSTLSDVPGPGTYVVDRGFVKKSFNITIGDAWE